MLQWLLSLLGIQPRTPAPSPTAAPARPNAPRPAATARPTAPPEAAGAAQGGLGDGARSFLSALVAGSEPSDLQEFSADDRLFLSGILKRIREQEFEIPLLPQAALEISRLLANPSSHMGEFVRVLEADPALSVEVLRIANSAFYGFASPTQSVHNAVSRIGLNQIRGLVIVAHLHGKVLRGGVFQAEARVLSDLSMAAAQTGQELADCLGVERDGAYTRGILSHVEHFIIMGSTTDIAKEHHRRLTPSIEGLVEAFRRFGPRVRELAAKAWGLEALMLDAAGSRPVQGAFDQLRRALVCEWTGAALTGVEGIPTERLASALRRVRPGLASGGGAGDNT